MVSKCPWETIHDGVDQRPTWLVRSTSKPIRLATGPEPTTKPLDAAHNLGVEISIFHKAVQALELHASQIQMHLRIAGIFLGFFCAILAVLGI